MRVSDLAAAMETIAPLDLAEPWDNVGLLAGSADAELRGRVVLAIDLTERVLTEATGAGAGAIVAYHPPIWEGLKRITDADARGRVLIGAMRAGIAIYSPHTALDAAAGEIGRASCRARV